MTKMYASNSVKIAKKARILFAVSYNIHEMV